MTERRSQKRLLCADLVQIDWSVRKLEGVLEDISPQGACVQTDEQIPPETAVSVCQPGARVPLFTGRVVYCVRRDCGYLVGIRFIDPPTWSRGAFEPKHLTNPELLG